jgi:hypothetical protein
MAMIKTSAIRARYDGRPVRYIGRASFETRSITIPKSLDVIKPDSVSFASKDRSVLAQKNVDILKDAHEAVQVCDLDTGDAIKSADEIFSVVSAAAALDGLENTLIDVSSFRREELLVLLAVLRSLRKYPAPSCELAYVTASKMADDWLSRNVIAHRSVVGYAGEIYPSRKTRLAIMMGFESERAKSIVENYEPFEIIVGMSPLAESINPSLHERNKSFFEDLRRQFASNCTTFEFSARDPIKTAMDLESALPLDNKSNLILAPIHTKLSTIGAGIFALKHREIQICYAEVDEYNEENYSSVGEDVYVFDVNSLISDIQSVSSLVGG